MTQCLGPSALITLQNVLNACLFFFHLLSFWQLPWIYWNKLKCVLEIVVQQIGRIVRMISFHGMMAWKLVVKNIQYLMGAYEHVLFFPLCFVLNFHLCICYYFFFCSFICAFYFIFFL